MLSRGQIARQQAEARGLELRWGVEHSVELLMSWVRGLQKRRVKVVPASQQPLLLEPETGRRAKTAPAGERRANNQLRG